MRISGQPRYACYVCAAGIVLTLYTSLAMCQEAEPALQYSELLELAVTRIPMDHGGYFRLVDIALVCQFKPVEGLDSPQAVPFLIDVLENGPPWTDEHLLRDQGGMNPHLARCYAALCLGTIRDGRAFGPLVEALLHGNYLEDKYAITYPDKDHYHISDYAALALGCLGDANAVPSLIRALQVDGRRYAIYGLATLRDIRGIRPIIEFASDHDAWSYEVHSCLENMARTMHQIKYRHESNTYEALDLPEIGSIPYDIFYATLWQYWLKEGNRVAERQFEDAYPKWKILRRREYPDDEASQRYVLADMFRQGILVLPFVMNRIRLGDESLVLAVDAFKADRPIDGVSQRVVTPKDRVECLQWWARDKAQWLLAGSEPACEASVAGDLNGDCRVDFLDLAILVTHWLEERAQ